VDVKYINPNEAQAIVVTGAEIENYSITDWDNLFKTKKEIVFARISP
jgi:magnesium-transporting ATPase (P-type)